MPPDALDVPRDLNRVAIEYDTRFGHRQRYGQAVNVGHVVEGLTRSALPSAGVFDTVGCLQDARSLEPSISSAPAREPQTRMSSYASPSARAGGWFARMIMEAASSTGVEFGVGRSM